MAPGAPLRDSAAPPQVTTVVATLAGPLLPGPGHLAPDAVPPADADSLPDGAPTGDDAPALEAAAALLRALASPVRMRLVLELAIASRCVHELVGAVALPQPLVSQHLRVLRISRLVRAERTGREIVYSLVDGHVAHVVADAVAHARESPS